MKKIKIAVSVLFFFACQLAIANSALPEKALQDQLLRIVSLQGDFTQALYDVDNKIIGEESSGTFLLQRPGRFHWETTAPYPQLLVSDQKTIWLYDPDLETVTVRPFTDELGQTPALLLSDDVANLSEKFDVTSALKQTVKTFTLTSKDPQKLFTSIQLVFIADALESLIIHDSLKQHTIFRLANTVANLPIDASQFNFTIPDGVDVLID